MQSKMQRTEKSFIYQRVQVKGLAPNPKRKSLSLLTKKK